MTGAERLEQQANLLFNNVSGWEQLVLTRIGKRIGKYSRMSFTDLKTINNALIVKQDMKAITKELAKITGYNISQVEKMYSDVIEQQHLSNMPLYDYRNKPFIAFAENEKLQAIVKAFAKTTAGNMVNLSKIGASHLGILDEKGKFKPIEKFYASALDKAVVQITSGSTDFYTAMRDTVEAMGCSGIRVSYPGTNITRRLDTAVRQSLLWGAKQASNAYNEMIGEELGCDGIEIDWHANPRPSHEFMQGKQYVLGRARVINGVRFESANEALERLEDYGCLHFKSPIICGVSEPRFGKKELERLKAKEKQTYNIDGKEMTGYEATQAMRRLETAVREQKAIKDIAQAEGDKELVNRCNKRIKTYQSKYDEISNITGIEKEPKRMSVSKGLNSV
jgi:NACalpha-BTF3-like transcription factor